MNEVHETIFREDGFTLIEVLVAMMVMGMVMMIGYSTLNFSVQALDRGVSLSKESEDIVESQRLLRDIFEQAIPERNMFKGSATEMTFLSSIRKNGGLPRVYEIILKRVDDDLVMKWSSIDDDIETGEVIIASNVSDHYFQYGSKEIYRTLDWSSNWNREDQPIFIRISLENNQFWPDVVIDLPITHTISCQYDPVSRECLYR